MKTKGFCILLAAALLTLSACGAKTPETASTSEASVTAAAATTTTTVPADESMTATEPVLSLVMPSETTEPSTATTTAAQTELETTTEPETTAAVPQTKAEILRLYNSAVSDAASRKASFSKQRSTDTKSYHDSLALKPFKSYVVDFMGLDQQKTYNVTAGTEHYERYLQKSTLTEADVASAEFTPDANGGGTIRLTVKPGQSSIDGGKNSQIVAPIDRSGIAAGQGDRSEWDHKTAQNAYAAIKDTYAGVMVEESYSNAVITAKVDANGALTALNADFDLSFAISKILASRGDATAHTTIRYTKFK